MAFFSFFLTFVIFFFFSSFIFTSLLFLLYFCVVSTIFMIYLSSFFLLLFIPFKTFFFANFSFVSYSLITILFLSSYFSWLLSLSPSLYPFSLSLFLSLFHNLLIRPPFLMLCSFCALINSKLFLWAKNLPCLRSLSAIKSFDGQFNTFPPNSVS